ncbi:MAG: VanW family protein [Candidatus Berkelbacteria bacterium]|nr:VanW family protein [Candidatus Berkelbacteria bacterium]
MAKKKSKEEKSEARNPKSETNPKSESNKIKQTKEKLRILRERIQLWKRIKWPIIGIGSFLVLFLIALGIYSVAYGKTSYRNVYVGDINLGGKSKADITPLLKPTSDQFLKSDIALKYQPEAGDAKEYKISSADLGLSYDADKTANDVYAVGRNHNIAVSFYQQLKTLFIKYHVDASFVINQDALDKKIADIAAEVDVPEKDFALKYDGNGVFELTSEKQEGRRINQEDIIRNVEIRISNIEIKEISFKSDTFVPQITEANAQIGLANANKILAAGPLTLANDGQKFSLDVDTIAGLIGSRPKKKEMEIYIISDKNTKQVSGIAGQIDKPAGNAVLAAQDGKVVVSADSQYGSQLDQDQAKIDIENALMARIAPDSTVNTLAVVLKVKKVAPEIDSAKLASYGLTELVASGTTNFVKSPTNRVHNINVGAAAISGALIRPGDEFSTLGKLGKINASTGYLPELVIKNNKTVPDYGGGLCQVSTTLFRTALNAGMKITARQNHSYRVSYYEPPIGMDATIFDPAPDFKFVNNYSNYIFIQSKIVGTKITFEFYGTKDSRAINIGQAVGYDYVEPPAPVETVDPALPVGTRNLVSHAHQGASAKFHYKVTRDGQILQETDFLSKYVALPEMWQVGPAETPAPPPETPAPAVDTPPPA